MQNIIQPVNECMQAGFLAMISRNTWMRHPVESSQMIKLFLWKRTQLYQIRQHMFFTLLTLQHNLFHIAALNRVLEIAADFASKKITLSLESFF